MTAPGVALVPDEPDRLEPAGQDSAPPASETGPAPVDAPPTQDLELELRGGLTVAKRVVEKIAEQAALEVTGRGEHQKAYAVRPGAPGTARPTVEVQLEGADAWLTIDVGLTYPTPLRAAADELRAHLCERLEELSGVTVKRLDIRISWLGATVKQPRRLR